MLDLLDERNLALTPMPQPRRGSGFSIESGYFVFTMMPSLYCHLKCPHCYLSVEQRADRTILSPEDIEVACRKVDAYWDQLGLTERTVVCYWYGGEPTSMGIPKFRELVATINGIFTRDKGYSVNHVVLSALVSARDDWFDVFHELCDGTIQSSYDGPMRGSSYVKKWERRMRDARAAGLRTVTISVLNRELLEMGPDAVLDYLSDLGVVETSFLPFMLNDQNASTGKYDELAPTMNEWSDFMIALTKRWVERKDLGLQVPMIGQMAFILGQGERPAMANIAAQTLFLLPNGDFVLPDYRNGYQEFMQPFGNILRQDFASILHSPARRRYLRRQVLRNGNPDCVQCPHAGQCVMEFWKPNRDGDDCFGGRRYVEWLLANAPTIREAMGETNIVLF